MKKVTLIHTVKSVLECFGEMLEKECEEELSISNIYDSFLADNPDTLGYVSTACKRKLYRDVLSAMENEPDVIVVTCSAMTETVKQIRPFIDTPLIAIDEAMIAEAVHSSNRIRVLATAASSALTTKETLLGEADGRNKVIEVDASENMAAFAALQRGDRKQHDMLVKEQAKDVLGVDVIVLAQASMAHLAAEIEEMTKIRVLSSPKLCIHEICRTLEQLPPTKNSINALNHTAVYTENIDWFVDFFENVFGMKVQDTEKKADGSLKQVWLDQGIQLIFCPKKEKDERGVLAHVAISVSDMDRVLSRAYSFSEVTEMQQGKNWLQLPEGIRIEVLDE